MTSLLLAMGALYVLMAVTSWAVLLVSNTPRHTVRLALAWPILIAYSVGRTMLQRAGIRS